MKRVDIPLAASFGLCLLGALPALASETADAAHEGGKKMLPQLDVTLYPGVLFWMVACFLTLLLVMHFVGLPGIQKTIGKRRRILDGDLKAARKAGEEAEAVVKAYEAGLHEARFHAQETVNEIVAQATAEAMAKRDAQDEEIKHRLRVAQENIAKAKETAMQEAKPLINDLVQEIVKKVMDYGLGAQTGKRAGT